MKRVLGALLLLSCLAIGSDFKLAKVLDVHDASALAEAAVANHPVTIRAGGEQTTSVPSEYLRCEITVTLGGTSYTAVYPEDQHFKITDYSVGDMIPARIEGKKLVLKRLDGKEMKAKILRQEPTSPPGL